MRFLSVCIFLLLGKFGFASNKVLYIYNGPGASIESLAATQYTLSKAAGSCYKVAFLDEKEIANETWTKDAALLVMPGGADLPYVEKLQGKASQIIKAYVKEGGSYLGICAGAYFGSGYVEFDKGGELEVLGERELQFFPGKAVGPLLAPYDYATNSGARAAAVYFHSAVPSWDSKKLVHLYFNGGPYFLDAENYKGVKVIGYYQIDSQKKSLPAILKIEYGKGSVVLSGVHVEYPLALLNEEDPYIRCILTDLEKSETTRQELLTMLFRELNLFKVLKK